MPATGKAEVGEEGPGSTGPLFLAFFFLLGGGVVVRLDG